jgi:tRNA modification GTPase
MIRNSARDTIAALATPPGAGALAVVRLSGPEAVTVAGRAFRGTRALEALTGFEGTHGFVVDGEVSVDEAVAWVYRGPRSYTGEDVVEITCHGGSVPARRVLDVLWKAGARPAEPGEFSRRAFLNGRLDLAQAEAVADLIAARGRRAQEQALAQLRGGLSERVRGLAGEIRGELARIEAHLDFGEDVPEAPEAASVARALARAEDRLDRLAASHAPSRRAREGMTVALCGRPNVGKSSLLNALLGSDRALVHETPGTTRDVVDGWVEWSGIPIRLVDTAGLREAADPVERAGVERSRSALGSADVILWVADGSAAPTAEDREIAHGLDFARVHLVLNKSDLGTWNGGWVNGYSPRGVHRASALDGTGIGSLVRALEGELTGDVVGALEGETVWVANERHAHLLRSGASALARARAVLLAGEPVELAAADLHRALEALAAITGERAGTELLDEIFRRFCIGK